MPAVSNGKYQTMKKYLLTLLILAAAFVSGGAQILPPEGLHDSPHHRGGHQFHNDDRKHHRGFRLFRRHHRGGKGHSKDAEGRRSHHGHRSHDKKGSADK